MMVTSGDKFKASDKVTEMLIGMLAFTDVIPMTNIVIYKNNLPYRQVATC